MLSLSCKWVSVAITIFVFFGLLSVAGNVHVAEFFGSMVIGLVSGGAFYMSVCGKLKNKINS